MKKAMQVATNTPPTEGGDVSCAGSSGRSVHSAMRIMLAPTIASSNAGFSRPPSRAPSHAAARWFTSVAHSTPAMIGQGRR